MAQPQQFRQAIPQQNKGTLVAGQTISVNKYTVQVERYLSQGGFAHVYLVRTPTPLFGTTHHVLKRIAVSNEAMLTEVKKEVDIMRILRGHPNIVYLIDAAWHRASNGTYEVFILMEFCPGGGIIDMMNRRLRERLTEPEILTIFVDVCEGLAAMHALKPPLLHRDLKVENILQSSATSYKLCDFGSATPVQKVPNNMAELRALETDLNRHTTLQYRAPEMVDVFLRRPIDEKSDVWALGVLLYKLCYYTTPFEEHGPLAILNVQYKIPPYPVYSQQMNALIASMLREHGAQRPTVFEILNHVHALRGTRSRFSYTIPPKHVPPVPLQPLSPNVISPSAGQGSSLDDLVTIKPRAGHATANAEVTSRSNGVEAREKVLEAIAPMRRGRPAGHADAPPSPKKSSQGFALDMKAGFGDDEDRAWKGMGVRGHKSGMASFGSSSGMNAAIGAADPWGVGKEKETKEKVSNGFDSDFSSSLNPSANPGFGDSFQPSRSPIPGSRPLPTPGGVDKLRLSSKDRDAFEGLGLPSSNHSPAPTLGEAHRDRERSRSGIGFAPSTSAPSSQPSGQFLGAGLGSSNTTYRPPSAHSPAISPQPPVQPARQRSRSPAKQTRPEMTAEERFPSLEELDKTFQFDSPPKAYRERIPLTTPSAPSTVKLAHAEPSSLTRHASSARPPSRPASRSGAHPPSGVARTSDLLGFSGTASASQGPGNHLAAPGKYEGTRSQHVTGIAMRESRHGAARQATSTWEPKSPSNGAESPIRPQPRRHRSSISVKPSALSNTLSPPPASTLAESLETQRSTPTLPPRPSPQPHDWLTGDDESPSVPEPAENAVLRDSPRKRASYIEKSPVQLHIPLEAESVEVDIFAPKDAAKKREAEELRGLGRLQMPGMEKKQTSLAASDSPGGLTENWSPVSPSPAIALKRTLSSSSDEGPEDVDGYVPRGGIAEKTVELDKVRTSEELVQTREEPKATRGDESPRKRHGHGKGRQNSVHDLVDLWGGSGQQDKPVLPTKLSDKRRSAIVSPSYMKTSFRASPSTFTQSQAAPSPESTTQITSRPLPRPPSQQQDKPSVVSPTPSTMSSSSTSSSRTTGQPTVSSGRSRPQSMFINPVTRTAPLESTLSHSSTIPEEQSAEEKSRRTARRTSISDMVQKYEAITGSTTGKQSGPPPPVASKPAGLSVKTISQESTAPSIPSPSAAGIRFPRLSPTSSPEMPRASLAVVEVSAPVRGRVSPVPRIPLSTSRPSTANVRPSEHLTGATTGGLPTRRATELTKPTEFPAIRREKSPAPSIERKPTSSPEQVRSPSPERPYQGVSKLIDRWQRVANDTNDPPSRTAPSIVHHLPKLLDCVRDNGFDDLGECLDFRSRLLRALRDVQKVPGEGEHISEVEVRLVFANRDSAENGYS
ncbi:hypothetical protein EIP86_004677 [Pleurotus ostreatoroseus]|nr:hypothetical protein EIP86_004677 [Pleurotus ostreatoroseus]